jgi:hypothetical protein
MICHVSNFPYRFWRFQLPGDTMDLCVSRVTVVQTRHRHNISHKRRSVVQCRTRRNNIISFVDPPDLLVDYRQLQSYALRAHSVRGHGKSNHLLLHLGLLQYRFDPFVCCESIRTTERSFPKSTTTTTTTITTV